MLARQFIPLGAQPRDDALGIDQRLGAAERHEGDAGRAVHGTVHAGFDGAVIPLEGANANRSERRRVRHEKAGSTALISPGRQRQCWPSYSGEIKDFAVSSDVSHGVRDFRKCARRIRPEQRTLPFRLRAVQTPGERRKRMVQARHIAVRPGRGLPERGCGGYAMFDPGPRARLRVVRQAGRLAQGQRSEFRPTPTAAPATSDTAALPRSLPAPPKTRLPTLRRHSRSRVRTAPAAAVAATPVPKPVAEADHRCGRRHNVVRPAAGRSRDKITEPRGRAYLFRGIAGLIYSRGMDKLADRIKRTGLPAERRHLSDVARRSPSRRSAIIAAIRNRSS